MEEDELDSYYLQDDLGSPMQLVGGNGTIREIYGFDEFGQSLAQEPEAYRFVSEDRESRLLSEERDRQGILPAKLQPFGFTGYQMDAVGGLYFAQARRYDAGVGRFVSEDKVAGRTVAPFTLNRYSYCLNRPQDYVDLNGQFPWLIIPVIIGVTVMLTGCSSKNSKGEPTDTILNPDTTSIPDTVSEEPVNSDIQPDMDDKDYSTLTEEEKILVATVCGEGIGEGDLAWKAVTNVIMNRVTSNRFPNTVTEVIQQKGQFSAYDQSNEYKKAMYYLENRTYDDELYEKVIRVTMAIYRGDDQNDITRGATLYYSPISMSDPDEKPSWDFDQLKEIYINGIESDSYRFFVYKDECIE